MPGQAARRGRPHERPAWGRVRLRVRLPHQQRPSEPEWFRRFFDARYVALLREDKGRAKTARENAFVSSVLGLRPGMRVLDVGCGYGRHVALLARRGCRVVGIDLSRAMLAEARRRWREVEDLELRRGDMRRLPFRGEFEAVICLFSDGPQGCSSRTMRE